MQLRDAGKLDLEDTLDKHVDGAAHAPVDPPAPLARVRACSGRRTTTSWLTLRFATPDELLETLDRAEQVLPRRRALPLLEPRVRAARHRHRARQRACRTRDYVRERLLQPLGLTRTSFDPSSPAANGLRRRSRTSTASGRGVRVETGAWIAAGQLWGTVGDLCRWARSSPIPTSRSSRKRSAEEMRTVQMIDEHVRWTVRLRARACSSGATATASSPGTAARCPASSRALRLACATRSASPCSRTRATRRSPPLRAEARRGRRWREWPVAPKPWRVEGAAARRRRRRCSASGSWRRRSSSSAGATASSRRSSPMPSRGRSRPSSSGRRRPLAHRLRLGARRGAADRARAARARRLSGHA